MSAPTIDRPDGTAADLMDAARAGDMDAFGQLYDRYRGKIYGFIQVRVGHRATAEDFTADVFVRALNNLAGFTWQGRDPLAWLYTIARNRVADHFKSAHHRLSTTVGVVVASESDSEGSWFVSPDPAGSAEDQVVEHLGNLTLLGAVRELSPEQREVIVLRYFNGLDVRETAQATGRTEAAVKALTYRATRRLGQLAPELGQGAAPKPTPWQAKQQRRQTVPCESCGKPLQGLLAECTRKRCQSASIAQTAREEQRIEATS